PGAFLASFNEGQTITWTVDGESVTQSATGSPRLAPESFGTNGKRVHIGPIVVVLQADTAQFLDAPDDPGKQPEPVLAANAEYFAAVKGELSVTPSGAAVYTVPIVTPPGIGGMAPNLSLVYNSQAGDGIAGQGWGLTGLSIIHRCAKTVVQDGHVRP